MFSMHFTLMTKQAPRVGEAWEDFAARDGASVGAFVLVHMLATLLSAIKQYVGAGPELTCIHICG